MSSTLALLISELDAIDGWPAERWAETLRQITKLFLHRAQGLAADQIALFDDVFVRLIGRVDNCSLAQLSEQFSEAKCALPRSARLLALHGDPSVWLPILKCVRLAPELILEVVQAGGPKHRLAIAQRQTVDAAVSEALLQGANPAIYHALVENLGARLPDADWARLVQIAEQDTPLVQKLARRSDLPEPLKRKIRAKLEDARMRHLNAMPGVMREQIENTIATADPAKLLAGSGQPDYARAQAEMIELGRKGKLNDSTINRFALRGEYTNIVAALALKTGSPVDVILPLLASDNLEGLVLACKASRLDWATAAAIIRHRPGQPPVAPAELEKARKTFDEFSLSAAQRTVRF
ncbi:MAG TPA: DUF2336 domain-containing protein [Bradyrhizobium sp.]|uniref:DUF2336 domain-containing protein n=1 Tax=Bradyrhizobium sp. TaxID=376 RepID=UPI002D7FF660|nr:DUF2336 domain-containing protein [Bradyrhizobium sp.]HET7889077.1 DUF2336 domain-containing protein [Bradyrhizobium sp.]